MSRTFRIVAWGAWVATLQAGAGVIVSQPPASGWSVSRTSQLWQDPSGAGNDLDGDAVCFQDFTVSQQTTIRRIEWWGQGACELGFRIQLWKQDPGTISYQPIGVFFYGGAVNAPRPTVTRDAQATSVTVDPSGFLHYTLDLATPITIAANDASNPRWFICVIGLTAQAYASWNWAQGWGGSSRCYQFLRGSGPIFRSLGDGRALVLRDTTASCPADLDTSGVVDAGDLSLLLIHFGACGGCAADLDASGEVDAGDLSAALLVFGNCP